MAIKVLAIYGVGNPSPGEVGSRLRHGLKPHLNPDDIHEFGWNEFVVKPNVGARGILPYLRETLRQLARASSLGAEITAPSMRGKHLWMAREYAFASSELSVAIWMAALFWLPLCGVVFAAAGAGEASAATLWRSMSPRIVVALAGYWFASHAAFVALAFMTAGLGAPFAVSLRRMVFVNARPALFLSALPFAVPWKEVARSLIKHWEGAVLFLLASLLFAAGLRALFRLTSVAEATFVNQLWLFLVALCAVYATVRALALFADHGLGAFFKVGLDVLRYATSPEYRHRIQQALETTTQSMISGAESVDLTIVAHSLGSVIAVHSLCSSDIWARCTSVTLVTVGSPLRRMFFRFFPGLLFPPNANTCASVIQSRVSRFRWFNCYRPFDYIGTSIGLQGAFSFRDIDTSDIDRTQRWRVLTSHTGYWDDPVVTSVIVQTLQRPRDEEVVNISARSHSLPTYQLAAPHRERLIAFTKVAVLVAMTAAPLAGLAAGISRSQSNLISNSTRSEDTLKQGSPTSGTLKLWQGWQTLVGQYASGQIPTLEADITYFDQHGKPRSWSQRLSRSALDDSPWRIDVDELRKQMHARQLCQSLSGTTKERPCIYGQVRLMLDPTEPSFFIVADFPPKARADSLFVGFGFLALAAKAFQVAVVSVLAFLPGYFALGWLVGESVLGSNDLRDSWVQQPTD